MSIVLHWWIVPILFVGAGLWFIYRPKAGGFYGPSFDDAVDAIFAICCFIGALSFIAGHYGV